MENIRDKLKKTGLDTDCTLLVVQGQFNSNNELNYKYLVVYPNREVFDLLRHKSNDNCVLQIKMVALREAYKLGAVDITKEVFKDFESVLKTNKSKVYYKDGCIMVPGKKYGYTHPFYGYDTIIYKNEDTVYDALEGKLKDNFYQNRFYINR